VRGAFHPDVIYSYIEAVYAGLERYGGSANVFAGLVNQIFNEHRIAFRLVDGAVVPLASHEMHVEVVEPVLRLLYGAPTLEKAHDAYLKALKEISSGDAPDAITDAGTALQEALTALGCEGRNLGALISDAKKKGLLGKHDQNLTDSIEKFLVWAAAERNDNGDAHKSSPAVLADAWLMVHIVGAIMLRLVDSAKRGDERAELT
jgi:hypothetical protein